MISFVCACFWINQLNLLSDYLLELVYFLFLGFLLWTLFTITKKFREYICANVSSSQRNVQPSAMPTSLNNNATTMDTFGSNPHKSDEPEISNQWFLIIKLFIEWKMSSEDVMACVMSARSKKSEFFKIVDLQDLSSQRARAEIDFKVNFINVPDEKDIIPKFKYMIQITHNNGKENVIAGEQILSTSNENQIKKNGLELTDNGSKIEELIEDSLKLDNFKPRGHNIIPAQARKIIPRFKVNKPISKSNPGEFNILLLGETGTGKSTTINAFASYMKFASFDEALSGEFTSLISSESRQNKGESCTQSPVGYVFKTANGQAIRIIDTPGMGDTSGAEVDRENFDQILNFVYQFENLHGICILIHSNETRKNYAIRYCITELLTKLHKSVCKNIIFCFTFARPCEFGAGDGYSILKTLLNDELHKTDLELHRGVNCFFIDNEAYRFLATKDSETPCTEEEKEKYEESWNKSSQNTNAMIDAVKQLQPHDIEQTRLLNHAQKLMMLLAEPFVLVMRNLRTNNQEFERKLIQMQGHNVPAYINVEMTCLQLNSLDVPKTVCSESRCVIIADHRTQNQSCHTPCREIEAKNGIIGSTKLKECAKMNNMDGSCAKCGCHWRKHVRLTAEYKQVKVQKINGFVQGDDQNDPYSQQAQSSLYIYSTSNIIDNLNKLIKSNRQQLEKLETVAAKVGYIALKNSNTSFNKFIEPVLDKLIDIESKKSTQLSDHHLYQQMKSDYKKRVQDITFQEISSPNVQLENIFDYCESLADIEPLGQVLQNFLTYSEKEFGEFQLCDIVVEIA